MNNHKHSKWQHDHYYLPINEKGEKRTFIVLIITAITMIIEIIAGNIFNSMALLADGWHMVTHLAAFGISIFAYKYAKSNALNPNFTFGTGKVNPLAGFASASALTVVALLMMIESLSRFFNPEKILFIEAISIALFGLIINIIGVFILKDEDTLIKNEHHTDDHNLKSAYFHVLADAFTSILAIIALLLGKYLNLNWSDPLIGVLGSIVIIRWSFNLIKETSSILLDKSIDKNTINNVKEIIEADSDNQISDIHIWKIAPFHYAAMISLVTHFPKSTEYYKNLLNKFESLKHITIEVNQCNEKVCILKDNL